MHEGKSPLGKPRAYPVSLASGEPYLVRLSLFGFGLSELGINAGKSKCFFSMISPFLDNEAYPYLCGFPLGPFITFYLPKSPTPVFFAIQPLAWKYPDFWGWAGECQPNPKNPNSPLPRRSSKRGSSAVSSLPGEGLGVGDAIKEQHCS